MPIKIFSGLSVATRLSLAYLALSTCWIVFGSRLANSVAAGNPDRLTRIEGFKGIFFVLVSTALIYGVSSRLYRHQRDMLKEMQLQSQKQLAVSMATLDAIYEFNFSTDTITMNANMMAMFGLDSQIQTGARKFWEDSIHPDDKVRVLERFDEARKNGIRFWREEYRGRTGKGQYRHILHSIYTIQDGNPQLANVIGYIQDLTELRELELQYHLRELEQKSEIARSVIRAEETERNRWAEELHDNIAQLLSVANLYTASLNNPNMDVVMISSKVREMIDLSIQEIRRLSANLKPPRFEETDLQEAINELTSDISRVAPIRFEIEGESDNSGSLTEEQQLMLYRVTQETINNIVKHANADTVLIHLWIRNGISGLTITDNGKGFDITTIREGTGLRNIRSRLELFNGEFNVRRAPGSGAEISVSFPL